MLGTVNLRSSFGEIIHRFCDSKQCMTAAILFKTILHMMWNRLLSAYKFFCCTCVTAICSSCGAVRHNSDEQLCVGLHLGDMSGSSTAQHLLEAQHDATQLTMACGNLG